MNEPVQTWHYGLMARHWAENNTTGPEIAYFQQQIEQYGQPALDAGCGTGRLLIPFLRAGLDVDGCDISGDMLAYCRQSAEREGFSPKLYQQALHELDLPRHYQTIVACGVIGVGVSRQQDFMALQRFYDHLLPGGMLILDGLPAYAEADLWPLWRKDARSHLPEPWPAEIGKVPADGREYELHYRLVAVDPLAQRTSRRDAHALVQGWSTGRPTIPTRSSQPITFAMKCNCCWKKQGLRLRRSRVILPMPT